MEAEVALSKMALKVRATMEFVVFQRDEHLIPYYRIGRCWGTWLKAMEHLGNIEEQFDTVRWQDNYGVTEKGMRLLDAYWE